MVYNHDMDITSTLLRYFEGLKLFYDNFVDLPPGAQCSLSPKFLSFPSVLKADFRPVFISGCSKKCSEWWEIYQSS